MNDLPEKEAQRKQDEKKGVGNPDPTHEQQAPEAVLSHTMFDTFEHLIMFVSLAFLAFSFCVAVHYIAEILFPIPTLVYNPYIKTPNNNVQVFLLLILVSEPIFAFFFLNTTKHAKENPAIQIIKIRRFLTYLALVLTFIILLVYIAVLIYNLLTGYFLASSFITEVTVITVNGSIFAYFFHQVRTDKRIVRV